MNFKSTVILLIAVLCSTGYMLFQRINRPPAGVRETVRINDQIFPYYVDEIRYLNILRGESYIELQKHEGEWRITHPLKADADEIAVENLLSRLVQFPVHRVLNRNVLEADEDGRIWPRYAATEPLSVTLGNGLNRRMVELGRLTPVGNQVYARRDIREDIMLLNTNVFQVLPSDVYALRDRTLFNIGMEQIHRIDIRNHLGVKQFINMNSHWQLQHPVKGPVSGTVMNEWLRALQSLSIQRFVTDAESAIQLDELAVDEMISLWSKAEDRMVQVLIGEPVPGEQGLRYARYQDEETMFVVPGEIRQLINTPPYAFRANLFSDIQPADVQRLSLQTDERAVELVNGAEWLMTQPESWPVSSVRLNSLLVSFTEADLVPDTEVTNMPVYEGRFSCSLEYQRAGNGKTNQPAALLNMRLERLGAEGTSAVFRVMQDLALYRVTLPQPLSVWLDPLYIRSHQALSWRVSELESITVTESNLYVFIDVGAGEMTRGSLTTNITGVGAYERFRAVCAAPVAEQYERETDWLRSYETFNPLRTITLYRSDPVKEIKVLEIGRAGSDGTVWGQIRGEPVLFKLPDDMANRLLMDFP